MDRIIQHNSIRSLRNVCVLLTLISMSLCGVRAQAQQAKPVRAEVVKPKKRSVVRSLKLPATLMADEQVDLFAKASGYVDEINVDIGSQVKSGDVLATISVPEMMDEFHQIQAILKAKQARVRALSAKGTQAQRTIDTTKSEVQRYAAEHELDAVNLKRVQTLREGDAIPEQALDEAKSVAEVSRAQLNIAQARVAGAEAAHQAINADVEVAESVVMVARANASRLQTLMEYASIKAPFDGVITKRQVDHGTFVRSAADGTTSSLLSIAKTDRIRVVMQVPEIDVPYVRVGSSAEVNVVALGEHPFPGKVSRVAGAINPSTRTMRVEVDLNNSKNEITPGMYAQVSLVLETKADALVIPSKAIRVEGKESVVFIVENGIAQSRTIQIGYDDGIWAEVLSGLQGAETVITASGGTISSGIAVAAVMSDS